VIFSVCEQLNAYECEGTVHMRAFVLVLVS